MKELNFKKSIFLVSTVFITLAVLSCNNAKEGHIINQRESENGIFPKGKKVTNDNFKGSAWLSMLVENDTIYKTQIGNVTFEPGARTKWHYHKGGQLLLVTKGKGYYQEKGKRKVMIQKGDVVKCPSNIIHWHGATATDT